MLRDVVQLANCCEVSSGRGEWTTGGGGGGGEMEEPRGGTERREEVREEAGAVWCDFSVPVCQSSSPL